MYRGHRKIMGVILHQTLNYYLETGSPHPNNPHIIASSPTLRKTHQCWVMSALLYVSARDMNSNPHVCAAPCWDFNKDCDPCFPIVPFLTVTLVCFSPAPCSLWHYFLPLTGCTAVPQWPSYKQCRTSDVEEGLRWGMSGVCRSFCYFSRKKQLLLLFGMQAIYSKKV